MKRLDSVHTIGSLILLCDDCALRMADAIQIRESNQSLWSSG